MKFWIVCSNIFLFTPLVLISSVDVFTLVCMLQLIRKKYKNTFVLYIYTYVKVLLNFLMPRVFEKLPIKKFKLVGIKKMVCLWIILVKLYKLF